MREGAAATGARCNVGSTESDGPIERASVILRGTYEESPLDAGSDHRTPDAAVATSWDAAGAASSGSSDVTALKEACAGPSGVWRVAPDCDASIVPQRPGTPVEIGLERSVNLPNTHTTRNKRTRTALDQQNATRNNQQPESSLGTFSAVMLIECLQSIDQPTRPPPGGGDIPRALRASTRRR
jgi:hypothetical protein